MKIFYPPFLTDAKLAAVEWKYSCRSPEDKGLMSVSQTWTARSLCCQPRILGNYMLWEVTGCGWRRGPCRGRTAVFWEKSLFWLLEISTVGHTGMRSRKRIADQKLTQQRRIKTPETSQSPPIYFQKCLEEWTVHDNWFA